MLSSLNKHWFGLQFLIAVMILAGLMAVGKFPNTHRIAVVLICVFIFTREGRAFLAGFAPFLLLLLTYDWLRNYADDLSPTQINVQNLIRWEGALFGGTLPGYYLQTHLWHRPYTAALDALTNFLYLSHYVSPLIISLFLWRKQRATYWAYACGLVALSYAGFVTYVLFPAAPPWWATLHGYLSQQPIRLDHFMVSATVMMRSANPVAAMPSLHAAYPTYVALVAVSVWGKRALLVFLLPLGVIFSIIYLGHHYVIDTLAGITYALVTFVTVYSLARKFLVARSPLASPGYTTQPGTRTGSVTGK
jgi:membrane-associated phospholipid phosphatase